mgnify:CR=1 FL=1
MNPNITNLKKAKSHIEKIIQMEDEGRYCIDVIQQLNAVIGYLNSVKSNKLENHLSHCFISGMKSKSKKEQQRLIDEVIQVTKITK